MLLPNVKRVLPWIRVTPELPPQRSKQTRSGSGTGTGTPPSFGQSLWGGGGVFMLYTVCLKVVCSVPPKTRRLTLSYLDPTPSHAALRPDCYKRSQEHAKWQLRLKRWISSSSFIAISALIGSLFEKNKNKLAPPTFKGHSLFLETKQLHHNTGNEDFSFCL